MNDVRIEGGLATQKQNTVAAMVEEGKESTIMAAQQVHSDAATNLQGGVVQQWQWLNLQWRKVIAVGGWFEVRVVQRWLTVKLEFSW